MKEKFKELINGGMGLTILGLILGWLGGQVSKKQQDIAIDRAVERRLNKRGITQKEKEDEDEKDRDC